MNVDDYMLDDKESQLVLFFADRYRVVLDRTPRPRGFVVFILMRGQVIPFSVVSKRLVRYPKQWLDSLQFKFNISGMGFQIVDAGEFTAGSYGIHEFMLEPCAIQSILSVDRMRLVFKAVTTDTSRLPTSSELSPLTLILKKWGLTYETTTCLREWLFSIWALDAAKNILGYKENSDFKKQLRVAAAAVEAARRHRGL